MNAICLVIDRFHAGYFGAYGNTWIETPSLDRLAAQSVVFDQALIDSPRLERLYRSYWQGWHAACPPAPSSRPGLAALLRKAGVSSALLTDEPQVANHPLAVEFDEIAEIDPPWQTQSAEEVEQTHFGRCFAQTINWLNDARDPFLLWCHLGGLGSTWDAPWEFRQAFQEGGDPPPPKNADVPNRMLPADYDPDELLGVVQSYAGQVRLLDVCLGALVEYLDNSPMLGNTLLTLISSRGFPLGEHRRVGPCDEPLYGESVHVPWLLRLPGAAAARSQSLVEPADLWATLLDFWGVDSPPHSPTAASLLPLALGEADFFRHRLCVIGDKQRAIRTPAWYLRATDESRGGERVETAGSVGSAAELFAKPDDRWEVNDVASRCPEVVERLQDALMQYELTLPAGRAVDLPPLDDVLLHGLG